MLKLLNIFVKSKRIFFRSFSSGLNNKIINFDDTKKAYVSKKSNELWRSVLVLKMCSYERLINNNKIILKWMQKIFGKRIFEFLMKKTFYGQFVAGENEESVEKMIKTLRKNGVKSIIDYSVEEDLNEGSVISLTKSSLNEAIIPIPEENVLNVRYQPSLKFTDRSRNVSSARTYFYSSEDQCDKHLDVNLRSIATIAKFTNPSEAFAAVKLSALGRPQLLLHLSEMLISMEHIFHLLVVPDIQKDNRLPHIFRSFNLDSFRQRLSDFNVKISHDDQTNWFTLLDTNEDQVVDLFEWSNLIYFKHNLANLFKIKNNDTGEWTPMVSSLTEEGLESMRLMLRRLNTIVEFAREKNVRIIMDAEQSYFQPAIRRVTLEMMKSFNKESRLVHNSYQCYLKNALDQVSSDLHTSRIQSFKIGLKLVRGAYIEQERERALVQGYDDPILPNFDATSNMYNECLDVVLNEVKSRNNGEVGVMVATHNEGTINHALSRMKQMKIAPGGRVVCFGQLLGMCDHLTFSLGQNGYSVYKVVPYGPIYDVLPYLSRRAIENRSIFLKVKRQRELLKKELWRRTITKLSFSQNKDLKG